MGNNNRVCEILGMQYPIVQAAMNWITNANMVAAVSNAGGMGVLGPNAGAKYNGSKKISTEKDRKSTRLNSSHVAISYAVFCLKKKKTENQTKDEEHMDYDTQPTI